MQSRVTVPRNLPSQLASHLHSTDHEAGGRLQIKHRTQEERNAVALKQRASAALLLHTLYAVGIPEPEPGGAGMSESENAAGSWEVHGPGLRAGGGRRKARASAGTEFRGVCWRPGEDAAAARMHGSAARTNFKQPATVDDGAVSSLLHAPAEPSGHDGRTKFLGVCPQPNGKFGARIRESKGKPQTWLGTFDTSEDAARAFDAAAARMHGAAARTNFKQPSAADDGGVSSLLNAPAEPSGHDGRTKFRGVCRQPSGKFGARIRDSRRRSQTWLGTFDTAEDAARAFDAAAVKTRGAAARTNFKQPAAVDDASLLHVPAELPSSSQDAQTEFRGVCRRPGSKFRARISKGKAETWPGTFDIAEDAARAFDAAAIKMRGPAARTNFKEPTDVDDGAISSLLAELSGQAVHRHTSGDHIALSLGGFDSPGTWHDDLWIDMPPAEWQQVEELLKDMDSTHDREALIEAAAILQHISLAGHGDGGR